MPQGSVLRTLLFLLYVTSELSSILKNKLIGYADDSTLIAQSPALTTIGGTVLKESDNLVILGVTFDSKITFAKHLRSVSRAASQRLGILRKSWQVFHDRLLFVRCFTGLSCTFFSTVLPFGAWLPIHTLDFWTE